MLFTLVWGFIAFVYSLISIWPFATMLKTFLKLVLYTAVLNVFRYYPIGWIELATLFEPMHAPMEQQALCFGFQPDDFTSSYIYNYLLWFWTVMIFHIGHRSIAGHMLIRSLVLFGLCAALFISLAAIYMNHFNQEIRVFFRWSMVDALVVFGLLALINGYLYPKIFRSTARD